MRTIRALVTFALASVAVVACGASPDVPEETATTSEALTGTGGKCLSDSNCSTGLVCDLSCPTIPNQAHCNIAGGTCQPTCKVTAASLTGTEYLSADGSVTLSFPSSTTFTKTVGCPVTNGARCLMMIQTSGTYASKGTTITLTPTTGAADTLTVEPHCYDGLYDSAQGLEVYKVTTPAACGGSIGVSCPSGFTCEGLPLPSSGIVGGAGTCSTAAECDPNAASPCPSGLVCVAVDLRHYGVCETFAAGETVGKGYACGASIGVSCVSGLQCVGVSHGIGGTGTCD